MMMMSFGFTDASTNEGHLRQYGKSTWVSIERAVMLSHSSYNKLVHFVIDKIAFIVI